MSLDVLNLFLVCLSCLFFLMGIVILLILHIAFEKNFALI